MKTCGLIGGMSWESSAQYYKIINTEINKKLGSLHSGKIILYSVDFEEIALLQKNGDWAESAKILSDAAVSLQKAGADFVLITTNTMHKVAHEVKNSIDVPFLDIRDALIEEIKRLGIKNVLLLGTKFTMEDLFYREYLEKHVHVVIPQQKERDLIHRVIFNELCLGVSREESKRSFVEIAASYKTDGVVLGCTEIGMLLKQGDLDSHILDTTLIHAKKAVELMIH